MQDSNSSAVLTGLRAFDARLEGMLARIHAGALPCVRASELAAWREELARSTMLMQAEPAPDAELAIVRTQCRNHLQELAGQLPLLKARLLTERARLEASQLRMAQAAAWAKANRESL